MLKLSSFNLFYFTTAAFQAQTFYVEDINAGSGEDPDMTSPSSRLDSEEDALDSRGDRVAPHANPFSKGRAAIRAAYAQHLGERDLISLAERIEAAYHQVSVSHSL